ncbi:MAG TPA: FecR family protein [Anaeromyxobacter sp.]|nr:FecR family protein [Anaeromyxobacter sp.]
MRAGIPAAALAGAALLAAAAPARAATPAGPAAPAAGTVTFLAGEATRAAGAARPEKLAVGGAVRAGDVLETRRRTRLEVRLADDSVLRLGPSSRAVVAAATFGKTAEERDVSAKLLVGKIWANVARAVGGEARFEVRTENAVAGVRGTTFRVDAAKDRSVVVKVYSGTVAVAQGGIPRPAHGAGREGEPERTRVPGPQEVSREQWETIVTSMMQVRVSAEGVPGEPQAFALADAGADEWEAWNRSRDAAR